MKSLFSKDMQMIKGPERYSTSLVVREIDIKTKTDTVLHLLVWLLLNKQTISIVKDVEKLEFSCTVGGNIKWSTALENSLVVPQNVKHSYYMIQKFHS